MRFGILSTANIGRKRVIPAIQASGGSVEAIASRDQDRADEVAQALDIPTAFGSYSALLEEAEIDAIYNPLPNSLHAIWTKRAADHGLDVLCEKPLTVDAEEAREVTQYCDEQDVTLMEAFMYRYHPRTQRAHEIAREQLGEIRHVDASFHFRLPHRDDIRVNPSLAGGSLMDVGCYTVSICRLLLGEPERAIAFDVDRRDCGVDTEVAGMLEFRDGATATISAGFDAASQHYTVTGTEGTLRVENAFVVDGETELRYSINGRTVTEEFSPTDQYRAQVEHFIDCVRTGAQPMTDGHNAVKTMAIIDALSRSFSSGMQESI